LDQDPQGVFIRRFVPELEAVPDHHLPQPHLMTSMEQSLFGCQIGKDYPAPIVDHKTAYKAARDRIFAVKKSAKAKSLAQAVYQKHGSRRQPMSQRR
jgi:deoxyribodipyrimidine photo-lyase